MYVPIHSWVAYVCVYIYSQLYVYPPGGQNVYTHIIIVITERLHTMNKLRARSAVFVVTKLCYATLGECQRRFLKTGFRPAK